MKTLKLDNTDSIEKVLSASTSKGNQIKYFSNNRFFKVDCLGYEGLAEVVASIVLECSTLKQSEYTNYGFAEFSNNVNEKKYGCYSNNFLKERESIITVYRLMQQYGIPVKYLDTLITVNDRLSFICDFVYEVTRLNIRDYLAKCFTLDAIILNEDRHLNNIAVIYNSDTNSYRTCPIFDNGLSFFSNIDDYPLHITPCALMLKVNSKFKTIAYCFEEQIKICGIGFKVFKDKLFSSINFIENDTYYDRIVYVLNSAVEKYPDIFI